jgi:hypothetical protein
LSFIPPPLFFLVEVGWSTFREPVLRFFWTIYVSLSLTGFNCSIFF